MVAKDKDNPGNEKQSEVMDADPDEVYPIVRVKARKKSKDGWMYLIEWEGNHRDTWEPIGNLDPTSRETKS